MKQSIYLVLDKERDIYMEYEEEQVLTRNDMSFLTYYLEREYQRGYDKGLSERHTNEKP